MTCQCTSSSRMGATSRSQREVIHAHGQIGSNQKSTFISLVTVPWWRDLATNGRRGCAHRGSAHGDGTDVDQFVLLAPNDQVWTIQRERCQFGALPADQRLADAAQFLPPDAVAGAPFTSDVGESAQSYQSAT